MPERLKEHQRIRFLKTIVEGATGDHPAFLLAREGENGTVVADRDDGRYTVYWDGFDNVAFIAEPSEIVAA